MSGDRILEIENTAPMAMGSSRNVFLHPDDDTKVLKVHREDRTPATIRARHWYWRALPLSRFDANAKDVRQYRRVAKNAPEALDLICPLFGYVETTRGRALVAEHVRDDDGRTSQTLRAYVQKNGLAEIAPALDEFFEAFAAHHVSVEDANMVNILVRNGGGRMALVLIDGLGDPTVFPHKRISKQLNRRKLMRKKARLFAKIRALLEKADALARAPAPDHAP